MPLLAGTREGELHETGRVLDVTGGQIVADGVFERAVLGVPVAGRTVQAQDPRGVLAMCAGSQRLREQVVVAEPLSLVVQRDEEHVVVLQPLEHLLPVANTGRCQAA